ncbi:MAG: trypsin-like peptidase domain-containing protein, partial [Chloroflexota bacterium]|nr:trypsin-like peptidase domain-containing protein [Chloroflexota bacterium]
MPTATPTPVPTATPVPTPSLSAIIERVKESVVRVETRRRTGSGVIFEVDGNTAFIVTNEHIFTGASQVTVTVGEEETEYRAELLGLDETHDLAVLRICCGNFRALPFGDVSRVRSGEEVVLIGYALDLEGEATVTRGIVSAVRYSDFVESEVIQTDAAANPGNSGGPMISTSGEVLGILTFGYRETEGLSFAISAETVQELIPTLLAGPLPELLKSFGPLEGGADDGLVRSGAAMTDFMAEVTVTNPKTLQQNWNYLLILRGTEADLDNPNRASLDGKGIAFTPFESIPGFDPSPGAENHIRVIAIDDRAWVVVNGKLGRTVDMGEAWQPGEFAFLNRPREGSGESGAVTFEEFQGLELRPLYGPEEGELEPVPGIITTHDSGVFARDFIAEAVYT